MLQVPIKARASNVRHPCAQLPRYVYVRLRGSDNLYIRRQARIFSRHCVRLMAPLHSSRYGHCSRCSYPANNQWFTQCIFANLAHRLGDTRLKLQVHKAIPNWAAVAEGPINSGECNIDLRYVWSSWAKRGAKGYTAVTTSMLEWSLVWNVECQLTPLGCSTWNDMSRRELAVKSFSDDQYWMVRPCSLFYLFFALHANKQTEDL